MPHFIFRTFSFISLVLVSFSCATTKRVMQPSASIKSLKYIGGYEIPFNFKYKKTIIGGLSGIDYEAKNNLYYLISDDRNDHNPVRFYKARIFFTQNGIDSLVFIDVKSMLQPNGKIYPNKDQDRFNNPDPESIRYNPVSKQLVWSSEGERVIKANDSLLVDPFVILIKPNGKFIDRFILPGNLKMQAIEKGPRRNEVLEGMSFADNYKSLFVNIEDPLYEDGPRADLAENKAFIRIYKFDIAGKNNTAQYAYKLEPVAYPANPETAFKVNGVSEILSLGNNKLLVMERSFSTGRLPCTIKLFIADLNGATDISLLTLKDNQSFIPVKKSLLLNMDDLGIYIDNIEGVTFGPLLPNGHKTLLFVADNNFAALQKGQVLLFEVIE
ncbi:MAG: esterase-like activity of phytase family protein [Ferruginibacter sp.]